MSDTYILSADALQICSVDICAVIMIPAFGIDGMTVWEHWSGLIVE